MASRPVSGQDETMVRWRGNVQGCFGAQIGNTLSADEAWPARGGCKWLASSRRSLGGEERCIRCCASVVNAGTRSGRGANSRDSVRDNEVGSIAGAQRWNCRQGSSILDCFDLHCCVVGISFRGQGLHSTIGHDTLPSLGGSGATLTVRLVEGDAGIT